MTDTSPTIDERMGRKLTLQEIAEAFATLAKNNGATDVLVAICGPDRPAEGKYERVAYMDAGARKVAETIGALIRLNWPDEAKALLVHEIYGMTPETPTEHAATQPQEWMN